MVKLKDLKIGDIIWYCCEYHWKIRVQVTKALYNGYITCKSLDECGIQEVGTILNYTHNDEADIFTTATQAKAYQEECKKKETDIPLYQLLLKLYDFGSRHMTKEEGKLYAKAIRKYKNTGVGTNKGRINEKETVNRCFCAKDVT